MWRSVGSGLRDGAVLGVLLAFGMASNAAHAQICFTEPSAAPGLPGVPDWMAPGVVRAELFDPRWLAAPPHAFESDATGSVGHFRAIVDATDTQLAVSIWAPSEPGVASAADVIYFGFTTDGTTATLARGITVAVPSADGDDPRAATNIQFYAYDAAEATPWTASLGSPAWLEEPAGFLDSERAVWGINFKISLSAAGLSPGEPFKLLVAAHVQNEDNASASVNVSTPDPGVATLLPGTRFIQDPTQWATTLAIEAGCPDGIALDASQIGTRDATSATRLDTSPGAVNRFFARPSVPAGTTVFDGLFEARFYLVPCLADAAPDANWLELGAGVPIANGAEPAADEYTVELVCPANTTTTTCGVDLSGTDEHCLAVALAPAPGQTVRFQSAVAYRPLDFGPGEGGGPSGASGGDAGLGGAGNAAGSQGEASESGGEPSTGLSGSSSESENPGSSATEGGAPMASSARGSSSQEGCGCRMMGSPRYPCALLMAAALLAVRRFRRARATPPGHERRG